MKLQSLLFRSDCCDAPALFFRAEGPVEAKPDGVCLSPGASLTTDTYLNLFDDDHWRRHTVVDSWRLEVEAGGSGALELWRRTPEGDVCCDRAELRSAAPGRTVSLTPKTSGGMYYLRVEAETEVTLCAAAFRADVPRERMARIGLAICTYHRVEQVTENLRRLTGSRFFDPDDGLYGAMHIHVADNGSQLPAGERAPFLRVFHNPNTGGSGGFRRALREFAARQDALGLTHIVFMDDDADFDPESFYRLHAFLSCLREAEAGAVIAGRMFRADTRHVQYTAAEIWNGGALGHVGFQRDMTEPAALETMNDSTGADYGGWWMCCYPADFALRNDPLPLFLHCDDVEYGLRCGRAPLLLNGVQVWHETYEYRQSPVITDYYDFRNPLFVNERHAPETMQPAALYRRWFDAITRRHVEGDLRGEYYRIAAMRDYLRGLRWLERHGARRHKRLTGKKHFSRLENMIYWRYTALTFRLRFHTLDLDTERNM